MTVCNHNKQLYYNLLVNDCEYKGMYLTVCKINHKKNCNKQGNLYKLKGIQILQISVSSYNWFIGPLESTMPHRDPRKPSLQLQKFQPPFISRLLPFILY